MDQAPFSSAIATSSLMTLEGKQGDQYYAMVTSLATKNGVKSLCAGSASGDTRHEKDALLSLIDSECARMSRLVDDMLFLASADAKTWNLNLETVDMDTLLIDLYESFQPLCHEKSISLRLELPARPLPRIAADPQRIRQLLMILLDNALTYTPSGCSICIRARAAFSGRHLTVEVANQGCRIPDRVKPYIFDRFYQADGSRSDKRHFGLGLSITKELVSLHGGEIQAADEPGGGACFSVTLPAASPSADAQ